jgi:hypothetical protein
VAAEEIEEGTYQSPPVAGAGELLGRGSPQRGSSEAPMRPDAFSSYRAGFEVRTLRRCERVLMYHHLQDTDDRLLVKATHFGYRNDPATSLSLLNRSRLRGTGENQGHRRGSFSERCPR